MSEKRIVKQDGTLSSDGTKPGAKKKNLSGSLISFCLGITLWIYGILSGLIDQIKTLYNASFGSAAQTASNSDFAVGGSTTAVGKAPGALIIVILGIASLLVILGLFSLVKRIVHNIKSR